MKTDPGRFFEDYLLGETIVHAVLRTLSGGERALYHALYRARHALASSDEFARACGLPGAQHDHLHRICRRPAAVVGKPGRKFRAMLQGSIRCIKL